MDLTQTCIQLCLIQGPRNKTGWKKDAVKCWVLPPGVRMQTQHILRTKLKRQTEKKKKSKKLVGLRPWKHKHNGADQTWESRIYSMPFLQIYKMLMSRKKTSCKSNSHSWNPLEIHSFS